MRIVPQQSNTTTTQPTLSAPSAPGLPDTLRRNLSPALGASSSGASQPQQPSSTHPLESRLAAWHSQQQSLKMTMLRRHYGIAEPVRRAMELQIVSAGEWRPATLGAGQGSARLHREILEGRDCEIGWEDVFTGEGGEGMGWNFHMEVEARQGMDW